MQKQDRSELSDRVLRARDIASTTIDIGYIIGYSIYIYSKESLKRLYWNIRNIPYREEDPDNLLPTYIRTDKNKAH